MTPQEFVAKWKKANLSERSACQQHFLDLCDLLGQPKPAAADPKGAFYTFERGVSKTGGGKGWADVWFRGHFGWEYKGKHKDLAAAYRQLLLYREDLENPPLLVVCDLDRFEIHTNFTGTAKKVHAFNLDQLAEPANLDTLRRLFIEPERLKPEQTTRGVTEQAAERFGLLADGMRLRGVPAHDAAHFLMKLMFCMFAEDIGLLPPKLFNKVLLNAKHDPPRLADRLRGLFQAMATGGDFGADQILHFNGGLFSDAEVIELRPKEIDELILVNEHDWASVEPSIFGTLFERTLDPAKRSQIGAHYTSRADIVTLLEPVVMAPLRREWAEVKAKCDKQWEKLSEKAIGAARRTTTKTSKPRKDHDRLLQDFVERLAHVTILDPACGSGNFLYVAINLLLDLEKEVITYAAGHGTSLLPQIRPTQLHGIEINPVAQQLAQVVIWIGYLQWKHDNGFPAPRNPVLDPIESIELRDAILDLSDPAHPMEPPWPEAEFIVGNPPFLGNRLIQAHLGGEYVAGLSKLYEVRLDGRPDICCYWFEKARLAIERGRSSRAGLLATQGIRGGNNRNVLNRIKKTGDIFFAESDREWVLDGASVHVSMVGFDNGETKERLLDGQWVHAINPDLTANADTTTAQRLRCNEQVSFQGGIKRGSFDISEAIALEMLRSVGNPHGRPNSDVILPYRNGVSITRRPPQTWIIDFGERRDERAAALYTAPFEHLRGVVYPERLKANQQKARDEWWVHWCTRPQMNEALSSLPRFLATARVSKHRIFVWLAAPQYPDCQLIVFARSDDYFFGVLHSRLHAVWAERLGTQVRERESGFRYTPTTCFETFPLPDPSDRHAVAVAEAATQLEELRNNWLNPAEWLREEILEFRGSTDGPWARYVVNADHRGLGTVRYRRLVARDDESAKRLSKRTLTNLYNQRPAWLDHAHRRLDAAVFAAYAWPRDLSDDEILEGLLQLNLSRRLSGQVERQVSASVRVL